MQDNLVRNFSKIYMSHNSFQNYRKMKMRKKIWIICAERAVGEKLFWDVIVKKKHFVTGASLQEFFLEWEQRLIPAQNTGNIMKCFGITSDTSKNAGKRHLYNRSACKTSLTNITFLIILSFGLLRPEDRTLQSIQIVHVDNTLYIVIINYLFICISEGGGSNPLLK